MKRSPLKRKPEKIREWLNRPRKPPRRSPSPRDGHAAPKSDALSRDAERMRAHWALGLGSCAVCRHEDYLHGHHITPLEVLKREGVPDSFWWDQRNRLTLCHEPAPNRCHDRHTLWVVRVPRAVVLKAAPLAREFAADVGLTHRFDHEYPTPTGGAAWP